MATRLDPSATGLLVRSFVRDIRARLRRLSTQIVQKVSTEDAFGLTQIRMNAEKGIWRFDKDSKKVNQFNDWLQKIIDSGIVQTDANGNPWTTKYVDGAYRKGLARAYADTNKIKRLMRSPEWARGALAEFLKTGFVAKDTIDKIKLLATRSLEELKGLSAKAAQEVSRVLTTGLGKKWSAAKMAREMAAKVDKLSKGRAMTIARTEMVHAQAEGQLDSFEAQGIEKVGLYVEWHTVGDNKVCPLCKPLEKVQFTIEEARGLIPRHPNCRCAWLPGEEAARQNRRRTMLRKLGDSILAEQPAAKGKTKKDRLKKAKKGSTWTGKPLLNWSTPRHG